VRKLGIALFGLFAAIVLLTWAAGRGWFGSHEGTGEPAATTRPDTQREAEAKAQREAATGIGVWKPKQILFGDLHVHTTFSLDAFLFSLPPIGSEGAHPPADACDFARYCSALDFWSINDHAEAITPRHWRETIDAVRQCNAVAGDPANPDTVAFLGWEWTQVGLTPADHYGHKNVVLAHTDDDSIPKRPIDAARFVVGSPRSPYGLGLAALVSGGRMHDFARYQAELAAVPPCDPDADVWDLPADCKESAATPAVLYRKLREWGHDALVIPHGTAWGFYTPPGSSWDKQLVGAQHDPELQRLVEVYSGHGDSEVYRSWHEVEFDADGKAVCPEARPDYLPMCVRAGQIIRARCEAAGLATEECARREREARANAAAAGVAAHRTVPGAHGADWLDAGQCRDCREPAYHYRPKSTAQYMLALGNFDDASAGPRRFRFGFMASSDNHYARPGTGYKEVHRRGFTESLGGTGNARGPIAGLLVPPAEEPTAESRPFHYEVPSFQVFETERVASFLTTGGLVAVHSEGRDRDAIWDALQRKEVYGTTGQRTLLWFELLNPPGSRGRTLPMGGEVVMVEAPIFQVRAVGSFEQKPGCPDSAASALGTEDLARICKGECYYPSDQRRRLTRIEVVKIRPQREAGEDVAALVSDPWRSFACDPDPAGCTATFPDADFVREGRDAVYYARVFEAPLPGINADNLRCKFDEAGNCTSVELCPGPEGDADDCLGEKEPRAWSSPIFVDHAGTPE
jgi:Protein of unknown function (DUF3604)